MQIDKLLLTCDMARRKTVEFGELVIFDDEGVVGLPVLKKQKL